MKTKNTQQSEATIAKFVNVIVQFLGTGGVGKTFIARLFVEYFLQRIRDDLRLSIIDTDEVSKQDLARFFPSAESRQLLTREDITNLYSEIEDRHGVTIVDVKADRQSEYRASQTFSPKSVTRYREHGFLSVCVIPITAGKTASMVVALDWFEVFGPDAEYIIVENEVVGPIENQRLPDAYAKFLAETKPYRLKLPKLEEDLARELDRLDLRIPVLLQAAGYEGIGALPPDKDPNIRETYGKTLTSIFNLPLIESHWETVYSQLDEIIPKLIDLKPSDETRR